MVLGDKPAPWEDEKTAAQLKKRFGHLNPAVMALLNRDPTKRPSMAALQHACHGVLSNTSTTPLNASDCDLREDGTGVPAQQTALAGSGVGNTSLTWEREPQLAAPSVLSELGLPRRQQLNSQLGQQPRVVGQGAGDTTLTWECEGGPPPHASTIFQTATEDNLTQ